MSSGPRPKAVVEIMPAAKAMIRAISDASVRRDIAKGIDDLQNDPAKQGKPLVRDLMTYRSVRVGGQRYRIVYKVTEPPPPPPPPEKLSRRARKRAAKSKQPVPAIAQAKTQPTKVSVRAVGLRKKGDKSDIYVLASGMLQRGEL